MAKIQELLELLLREIADENEAGDARNIFEF